MQSLTKLFKIKLEKGSSGTVKVVLTAENTIIKCVF